MKITLLSDQALRLEPAMGPLTIEAPSFEWSYSPFHMLASGLAICTFSVLQSWASTTDVPVEDLVLEVTWTFADDPHRVGTIDMTFEWPSLPMSRRAVIGRVAALCPIHATFAHPPVVRIREKTSEQAA